jgi:hypothetical protein
MISYGTDGLQSATDRSPFVSVPSAYRYETVARFITDMVEQGALTPGARAPSLRRISRQRGVSLLSAGRHHSD